ncbi:MAG: hypothetical protein WCI73_15470 [Phycisphaerae bacterium]
MDESMKALAEVVGNGLAEAWLQEQAQKHQSSTLVKRHARKLLHSKSNKRKSHAGIGNKAAPSNHGGLRHGNPFEE